MDGAKHSPYPRYSFFSFLKTVSVNWKDFFNFMLILLISRNTPCIVLVANRWQSEAISLGANCRLNIFYTQKEDSIFKIYIVGN